MPSPIPISSSNKNMELSLPIQNSNSFDPMLEDVSISPPSSMTENDNDDDGNNNQQQQQYCNSFGSKFSNRNTSERDSDHGSGSDSGSGSGNGSGEQHCAPPPPAAVEEVITMEDAPSPPRRPVPRRNSIVRTILDRNDTATTTKKNQEEEQTKTSFPPSNSVAVEETTMNNDDDASPSVTRRRVPRRNSIVRTMLVDNNANSPPPPSQPAKQNSFDNSSSSSKEEHSQPPPPQQEQQQQQQQSQQPKQPPSLKPHQHPQHSSQQSQQQLLSSEPQQLSQQPQPQPQPLMKPTYSNSINTMRRFIEQSSSLLTQCNNTNNKDVTVGSAVVVTTMGSNLYGDNGVVGGNGFGSAINDGGDGIGGGSGDASSLCSFSIGNDNSKGGELNGNSNSGARNNNKEANHDKGDNGSDSFDISIQEEHAVERVVVIDSNGHKKYHVRTSSPLSPTLSFERLMQQQQVAGDQAGEPLSVSSLSSNVSKEDALNVSGLQQRSSPTNNERGAPKPVTEVAHQASKTAPISLKPSQMTCRQSSKLYEANKQLLYPTAKPPTQSVKPPTSKPAPPSLSANNKPQSPAAKPPPPSNPMPIIILSPHNLPLQIDIDMIMPLISYILPSSPLKGVVEVGDILVFVDGKSTAELSHGVLTRMLNGGGAVGKGGGAVGKGGGAVGKGGDVGKDSGKGGRKNEASKSDGSNGTESGADGMRKLVFLPGMYRKKLGIKTAPPGSTIDRSSRSGSADDENGKDQVRDDGVNGVKMRVDKKEESATTISREANGVQNGTSTRGKVEIFNVEGAAEEASAGAAILGRRQQPSSEGRDNGRGSPNVSPDGSLVHRHASTLNNNQNAVMDGPRVAVVAAVVSSSSMSKQSSTSSSYHARKLPVCVTPPISIRNSTSTASGSDGCAGHVGSVPHPAAAILVSPDGSDRHVHSSDNNNNNNAQHNDLAAVVTPLSKQSTPKSSQRSTQLPACISPISTASSHDLNNDDGATSPQPIDECDTAAKGSASKLLAELNTTHTTQELSFDSNYHSNSGGGSNFLSPEQATEKLPESTYFSKEEEGQATARALAKTLDAAIDNRNKNSKQGDKANKKAEFRAGMLKATLPSKNVLSQMTLTTTLSQATLPASFVPQASQNPIIEEFVEPLSSSSKKSQNKDSLRTTPTEKSAASRPLSPTTIVTTEGEQTFHTCQENEAHLHINEVNNANDVINNVCSEALMEEEFPEPKDNECIEPIMVEEEQEQFYEGSKHNVTPQTSSLSPSFQKLYAKQSTTSLGNDISTRSIPHSGDVEEDFKQEEGRAEPVSCGSDRNRSHPVAEQRSLPSSQNSEPMTEQPSLPSKSTNSIPKAMEKNERAEGDLVEQKENRPEQEHSPPSSPKMISEMENEEADDEDNKRRLERRNRPSPNFDYVTVPTLSKSHEEEVSTIYGGKWNSTLHAAAPRRLEDTLGYIEEGYVSSNKLSGGVKVYDYNTYSQLLLNLNTDHDEENLGHHKYHQHLMQDSEARKLRQEEDEKRMKEELARRMLRRQQRCVEGGLATLIGLSLVALVVILVLVLGR